MTWPGGDLSPGHGAPRLNSPLSGCNCAEAAGLFAGSLVFISSRVVTACSHCFLLPSLLAGMVLNTQRYRKLGQWQQPPRPSPPLSQQKVVRPHRRTVLTADLWGKCPVSLCWFPTVPISLLPAGFPSSHRLLFVLPGEGFTPWSFPLGFSSVSSLDPGFESPLSLIPPFQSC